MKTSTLRILIVDDDHLMLTLLTGVLKQEGYTLIDRAKSGREALEKCAENPPDIIFMDIEMPEMNGIETMQALHEQGVKSHVILVSANPKTEYVMSAKEKQAEGFVVKPLSAKIVSNAIEHCLKKSHPGQAGTAV